MEAPIYTKQAIPYEKKDGNYAPEEYQDFLQDLVSKDVLDETPRGIAVLVLDKGTAVLSQKQLYVLQTGTANYRVEHCHKCHTVLAVDKDAEWPFYCDLHDEMS